MIKVEHILLTVLIASLGSCLEDCNVCNSVQFAVDFYSAVKETPSQNVIVSPLSVQTSLALLLMGAEGNTADQIVNGLHLKTDNRSAIASSFQRVLGRYSGSDLLKVVNKVYVKNGLEVEPKFDEVARSSFHSETDNVDFEDSKHAAEVINSWVEEQTNHKIKELFSDNDLQSDTRMVLVNAVHFKAPWDDQFQNTSVSKKDFWLSENEVVKVDMMHGVKQILMGKSEELDAKIGMIPYEDKKAHMLIIHPNSRTGLSSLEEKLKTYDFTKAIAKLEEEWTFLQIPKFKVETSVDLTDVLSKLGMQEMFSSESKLSNLLKVKERLQVDKAIHKAFVSVDEEGTEAAAATGYRLFPVSIPPEFVVEHPFFFAILTPETVTFVGSVRHLE